MNCMYYLTEGISSYENEISYTIIPIKNSIKFFKRGSIINVIYEFYLAFL